MESRYSYSDKRKLKKVFVDYPNTGKVFFNNFKSPYRAFFCPVFSDFTTLKEKLELYYITCS